MTNIIDVFAVDLLAFAAPRCQKLLADLFANDIWADGEINGHRVRWTDGARHRRTECFKARGVYIWGVDNRPLYVGKTGDTFAKRFNRYIWQENSQCTLATRIDPSHDRWPDDMTALLKKNRRLRSRIEGSLRFAKEGIDGIWFALFPIAEARYIEAVEAVLIAAVNDWNRTKGFSPMLNVLGAATLPPNTALPQPGAC